MRYERITRLALTIGTLVCVCSSVWAQPSFGGKPGGNPDVFSAARADFWIYDPNLRIVLVDVSKAYDLIQPQRGSGDAAVADYDVLVQCEFRGNMPNGTKLRIEGHPFRDVGRGYGGNSQNHGMPLMQTGKTYVLPLLPIQGQDKFQCLAGDAHLIGLNIPCEVSRQELPLIKTAMVKLGEIVQTNEKMPTQKEAQEMFLERGNYYLWALGETALAVRGNVENAQTLIAAFQDYKGRSIREMLWLDYSLGNVVLPLEWRQSSSWRYEVLVDYLRHLPDTLAPTTAP